MAKTGSKVTITVTRRGPPLMVIHLNGKKLTFKDDVATRQVGAGEHAMTWFVRGTPGAAYSVAITTPVEVKFDHSDRLDGSMKDAGLKWFTVK